MLPIRSWKTAISAAPVPSRTSTTASVSERRDGAAATVVLTTVVTRWVGLVAAFASTVVTVRPTAPPVPGRGSQIRQIATQTRSPASGIRTIGTMFAPAQASRRPARGPVVGSPGMRGLYAFADICQQGPRASVARDR